MAGIALIEQTNPLVCASDHFLDSLQWIEAMSNVNESYMTNPPSPVFNAPDEPRDEIYVVYLHLELVLYHDEYYRNHRKYHCKNQNKMNFKNQNKHFRKMGHLKQPGGASCNQRR